MHYMLFVKLKNEVENSSRVENQLERASDDFYQTIVPDIADAISIINRTEFFLECYFVGSQGAMMKEKSDVNWVPVVERGIKSF